jgi:hypothetical protein
VYSDSDLANALMCCVDWDPKLLHSRYSHLLGAPILLADNIPFAAARELLVDPDADNDGRADVDDFFAAMLTTSPERASRAAKAILLASLGVHRYHTHHM